MQRTITTLALASAGFGVGCAGTTVRPVANISHVVLFDLDDSADQQAFIDDCHTLLGGIPGVTSIAVGPPFETGRDVVVADYDIGVFVGFESPAAYEQYLVHPDHDELVETWKPRFAGYRVYDFEDVAYEK